MAERVYPSNRPGVQNLNGAYTKGQMYGAALPTFRPTPPKRRRNRCCLCFLCLVAFLLVLILQAGIAALVIWVIYRPHQPSFTLNSVQIPKFNVTKDSHLSYEFDLQMDAKNPNKKVSFYYDVFSVKVSSGNVDLADGSVPGFFHGTKNTTVLKSNLKSQNLALGASDAKNLKSAQSKGKIKLDVDLQTRVRVKMGKWKSHNVKVDVKCKGVSAVISGTKKASPTANSDAKCEIKLKFKVFKWYL
jgi:hypothetical protein